MRAARLHEYTDNLSSAFEIDDVEKPKTSAATDIVIRVNAAGWCHTDNHIVKGHFENIADVSLPQTLGHENAGTVTAVGGDVSVVELGDEVVLHPALTCGTCRACRLGQEMRCENHRFCGMDTTGGFAEYILAQERCAIPLDTISPREAAPHADAGLTAYHAVKSASKNLVPGDTVLTIGVGGLGHIGVQLLDEMSVATIIAADVKAEALDHAEDAGADYVVNTTAEDPIEMIDALTDGNGASIILDFVGSDETLEYALPALKQGGDHLVVGYGGTVTTPAQALVGREVSYSGTLCGTFSELQELMSLVENGRIDVRTHEFPLSEINDVADRLEAGKIDGRAVLRPSA